MAVGERRELLDYGIDFSADVDTGNAVLYALKGLTGLFPGTFKRIPVLLQGARVQRLRVARPVGVRARR